MASTEREELEEQLKRKREEIADIENSLEAVVEAEEQRKKERENEREKKQEYKIWMEYSLTAAGSRTTRLSDQCKEFLVELQDAAKKINGTLAFAQDSLDDIDAMTATPLDYIDFHKITNQEIELLADLAILIHMERKVLRKFFRGLGSEQPAPGALHRLRTKVVNQHQDG